MEKNNKRILDKFEKFLIKNDCYSQFVTDLLEQKNLTIPELIELEPDSDQLIMHCFAWSRTPEGADYWLQLYYKWRYGF